MLDNNSIFLNKYQILQPLGKGGMGSVYLARGLENGRLYALKEQLVKANNLSMILTEIEIQKKLQHPSLPKIEMVHETSDYIYIVMDYIEGTSLDHILKQEGKFPEARVRKWALQVCDILCYLHSLPQPVVYRDMKPSNIMIDRNDDVHLIDFGIAQEYENPDDPKVMALTRGYAAPEQYNPKYRYDVRTDIYAFGATFHYLLTGKNPTKPPHHFVKVRKLEKSISYAMEEIVFKCLQLNPDHRYASAQELYTKLQEIDEREAQIRRLHRLQKTMIGLLIGLVLVVATFVFLFTDKGRSNQIESYEMLLDISDDKVAENDFKGAKQDLEEAIDMVPQEEAAYIRMIDLYRRQGEYEKALTYVSENILDRFPDIYGNADYLTVMWMLYSDMGQDEDAAYYQDLLNDME